MSHITLPLDDATQQLLEQAARASGQSPAAVLSDLIRRHLSPAPQTWPSEFLALAGSIPDFPLQEETAFNNH